MRLRIPHISAILAILAIACVSIACQVIGETDIFESNLETPTFEELKELESGEIVDTGPGYHEIDFAENCENCHPHDSLKEITLGFIRFDHELHLNWAACGDCHGDSVHTRAIRPGHERCNQCHEEESDAPAFTYLEKSGFVPGSHTSSWTRTHGKEVLQSRAAAGADYCGTCHKNSYCDSCHAMTMPHPEGWKSVHPAVATSSPSVCESCHTGTNSCVACHGTQIPHRKNWTRAHGDVATGDRGMCNKCHAGGECSSCHGLDLPHPGVWSGTHGERGLKETNLCQKCHTEEYCSSCHGTTMPHPDDFVVGHGTEARTDINLCSKCHKPSLCSGCHGIDLPHPATFITEHAGKASENLQICAACHSTDSFCTTCHGDTFLDSTD